MSAYTKKFKDPRWQKKRLEILELCEFTCESCGDDDKTLNVHHLYYEKNKDPWEYPEKAYSVLCENCHSEWHENKLLLDKNIGPTQENISLLIGYAKAIEQREPFECINMIECSGFADFYRTNLDAMRYLVNNMEGTGVGLVRQSTDFITALEYASKNRVIFLETKDE